MKCSQGQRAGGCIDLKGMVLEDEVLSRAVCWRMKGSQGQSAGG